MLLNGDDGAILAEVRGFFGATPPPRLAVAVSGGGDSVALLHVLGRCFPPGTVGLVAATVDHGLRPEAAAEAAAVADLARSLGVPHAILRWTGWDGAGNLQDRARRGRYALLAAWAADNALPEVALAHTADDQAETVLMRLGRAAGVDGLSGIAPRRRQDGVRFVRPALGLSRAALRAYLVRHRLSWAEDPSNADLAFDRIRARRALEALAPLGLGAAALAAVAANMGQARAALEACTDAAARDLAGLDAGDVLIDRAGFAALPQEIARRLLSRALQWIGGGEYPPRRAPVAAAIAAIRRGGTATLAGCLVLPGGARARVCRELAAVRHLRVPPGAVWDRRWRLDGPDAEGCEIGALGWNGLADCPGWRDTGRPRAALAALPAVWRGAGLVAAPLAGAPNGWRAELLRTDEEFLASSLSH